LRERTEPASRLVALLAARILLVTLTLGPVVEHFLMLRHQLFSLLVLPPVWS